MMEITLDINELIKRKKELVDEYNKKFGDELDCVKIENEEEENTEELSIGSDGVFTFSAWINDDIGAYIYHSEQLSDNELIEIYDNIKIYFKEKQEKIDKIRQIANE